MSLLFLNALKGLRKKKVQMIGIIFMVLLSAGIYTTMNAALDRLENRYYTYLDTQNVEHFSFVPVINYEKDISVETLQKWNQNELKDMSAEDKQIIGIYGSCLQTSFDMCKSTGFQYLLESILQKYNALDEITKTKVDSIKKTYDFTYEKKSSKLASVDKYTYKAIPYQKEDKINKPYLVEGTFPNKDNEITLLPNFAGTNQLEIGDWYDIDGKKYKITGFAMAPDYIYPMLSINSPIFDEKYNVICYMNEKTYDAFDGVNESVYVANFNHAVNRDDTLKVAVTKDNDIQSKNPAAPIFEKEKEIVKMDMNTMIRVMRINAIQLEFSTDRKFAEYFLYLLLFISVFIIMIITKKRIEDEKLQIGVLKSLGYKSHKIAVSYLVYPVVGSLIGGLLGFLIGMVLNGPVAQIFLSYFNVPLAGFSLNIQYLLTSVFLPLVLLSLLSYLISIFMLRKKPLDLLKEGSHLKVGILSKVTNFVTKKLPFASRFRYSLASRSVGKLFIVSLTSFCTGLLIVLVLIGMNLFNSVIATTFDSFAYKYEVTYKEVQTGTSTKEDLVLNASATLLSVKKDGKVEKVKEDTTITINGMDTTKYIKILDSEEKDLSSYLGKKGMIINTNIAEVYQVKVGDSLLVKIGEEEFTYEVLAVSDGYMGNTAYMGRNALSRDIGLRENSYTEKYSTDSKYSSMKKVDKEELSKIGNIFSIEDLRRNMEKQMQTANSSIYIVILFASIMAFIIIAVIANIVVEENKKTISLMKVLGYKNKEIGSIVLNIYTPFVIVSYLLSIPVMIGVLKWIVSLLVGDMNMALPVTLSPVMAIVGLAGLLLAYYIAILLSRRVLNKVPLAVALKRE